MEFGNSLFLAENTEGFIFDHELKRGISRGDAKWLRERYAGLKEKSGERLCGIVADRGFESKANRRLLDEEDVFDGLCPRDPGELARRMEKDDAFLGIMFVLSEFAHATVVNIAYSSRGIWSVLLVWIFGHWFVNPERDRGRPVMLMRLTGSGSIVCALWLVLK